MKTKKKLLIGTAIMALAAGGASAVSTMAWFKASGGVSGTSNAQTLTVTKNTLDGLTLEISTTQPDPVKFTDSDGVAKFINGQDQLVPDANQTNLESSFTVTLNSASTPVAATTLKQYAGSYTLKVGGSKVESSTNVYDNTSRAKIAKESGSAKTAAVNYVEYAVTISAETGLIKIGDGTAALSPEVTVYAAVSGGTSSQNDGASFSVSVAAWLS